jgi:hypothetical protein
MPLASKARKRQQARAHDRRRLVDAVVGGRGALAHEDRVRRPIGRVGRLANVVEQQHRLARLGVAHFDPARERLRLVGDIAFDAEPGQFVVGQSKQAPEGFGRQPGDAEGYGELLDVGSAPNQPRGAPATRFLRS